MEDRRQQRLLLNLVKDWDLQKVVHYYAIANGSEAIVVKPVGKVSKAAKKRVIKKNRQSRFGKKAKDQR